MRVHERIVITYVAADMDGKSTRQIPLVVFEHTKHDRWVPTLTGFARDDVPGAHGIGLRVELAKAVDALYHQLHDIAFED